jgi:hypothetical protein
MAPRARFPVRPTAVAADASVEFMTARSSPANSSNWAMIAGSYSRFASAHSHSACIAGPLLVWSSYLVQLPPELDDGLGSPGHDQTLTSVARKRVSNRAWRHENVSGTGAARDEAGRETREVGLHRHEHTRARTKRRAIPNFDRLVPRRHCGDYPGDFHRKISAAEHTICVSVVGGIREKGVYVRSLLKHLEGTCPAGLAPRTGI